MNRSGDSGHSSALPEESWNYSPALPGWTIYDLLRGIDSKHFAGIALENTAYASMTSGESVSGGAMATPMESRLSTTTKRGFKGNTMSKLLDPITPGEILLEEYLKPLGLTQNQLAR